MFPSDYLAVVRGARRKDRFRKILAIAGISIVALYFIYQTRDWIRLPYLAVDRPVDGVLLAGPSIIVSGMVTPSIRLTVNNVEVYSEKNGEFETELLLQAGLHTITVIAENRFGRISRVERQIVVE
jgi:hypothetical protein